MKDTNQKKNNNRLPVGNIGNIDPQVQVDENLYEIRQHGHRDYPVGMYQVNVKENHMHIVPWHWHKEVELIHILEGCGKFLASDDSFLLYPGDSLFINSEVMHGFQIAEGYENCIFISIVFDPGYLIHPTETSLYAKYIYPITQNKKIRGYCLPSNRPDFHSHSENVINIYNLNYYQTFGYEIHTKKYLTTLWLDILNEIRQKELSYKVSPKKKISLDESRAKEAIQYIEEHYSETITLDDIANAIPLSKSECCRCIKRCMNMTPFEYLMRFRILKAAEIISSNLEPISIADLAINVGINSSSYFNKLFKKHMGCTPTQYKKKMQD